METKMSFEGFRLTPEQAEALGKMAGPDGDTPQLTPEQSEVMDRILAEIERQVNDPEATLSVGREMGIKAAEMEVVKGLDIQAKLMAEMIVSQCAFSSVKTDPGDCMARAMAMLTQVNAIVMFSALDPKDGMDRNVAIELGKASFRQLRKYRENPDKCAVPTMWERDQ